MTDRYQVLTSVDGKTSLVIEQNSEIQEKPKWKVVVPDAGSPTTAAKIARLFNKEHDEVVAIRNARHAKEGPE